MKHRAWSAALASVSLVPTACVTDIRPASPPAQLANPASTYCVSLGGTLEPRRSPDGGEYAMCHLPNGLMIEEWELYRRDHR